LKFLEFFLISVTLLNDTTNEVALFEKAKAKLLGEWVMVGGTGLAQWHYCEYLLPYCGTGCH
jgi:hypothetical protein